MRLEILFLAIALVITATLGAEDLPGPEQTPREAYQKAATLFAQGHVFDIEESAGLEDLRARLIDTGDQDLAADLELLRWASTSEAQAGAARIRAQTTLEQDATAWADRERVLRDRKFWAGVRDVGLATFTVSSVATLLLAAVNDRNDALMRNGFFDDWQSRQDYNNGMKWAMAGSASVVFFSLFPLLWGESRQ